VCSSNLQGELTGAAVIGLWCLCMKTALPRRTMMVAHALGAMAVLQVSPTSDCIDFSLITFVEVYAIHAVRRLATVNYKLLNLQVMAQGYITLYFIKCYYLKQ